MIRRLLTAALLAVTLAGTALAQSVGMPGPGLSRVYGPPTTNLLAAYIPGASQSSGTWSDTSGNGKHMTMTNTTLNANATYSFNGTSAFGSVASFTQAQPIVIYIVLKQDTWVNNARILTTPAGAAPRLLQNGATGEIELVNGETGVVQGTGVWNTISAIYNNDLPSASGIQKDSGSAVAVNFVGTTGMSGLSLGAFNSSSNFAAITVAALLIYSGSSRDSAVLSYCASIASAL